MQLAIGRLSRVIEAIYDAAMAPELFDTALRQALNLFDGSAAVIHYYDVARSEAAFVASVGIGADFRQSYLDRYAVTSPLAAGYLMYRECEPITQPMVIEDAEFRETAFYREWVLPQGFHTNLSSVLSRTLADWHALTFIGSPPRARFAGEELELMQLLAPHFRKALKIAGMLERDSRRSELLSETLDRLALGAIAVTRDGRILHANAVAETELRSRSAIMSRDGHLQAVEPQANGPLQRDIAFCVRGGAARDVALGRGHGLDGGLVAHILPLVSRSLEHGFGEQGQAVVFFRPAEAKVEPPLRALAERYGLTGTEARVLAGLLGGADARRLAERHGVAVSTIRTHLHHLFEKTGARNRAELVASMRDLIPDVSLLVA